MTRFGYFLSCEEYGPADLVRQARLAEEAGFDEVYIGQVGGEHEGFFEFYVDAVLPRLREG
jgi:alkanesulfonate monooxygenase SsuD/methylene tetrahydromethanopterin reductase-like flavin-dependent oxidoreductase (luciferase family)